MKSTLSTKTECRNPHSGRSMKIDKETYDLVSKAIFHALKKHQQLGYSDLVEEIKDCFKAKNVKFERSVSWYAITVKNDLEARGMLTTFTEKGKKWNRLK